jgi:uncharacterized protein (TIGR02301 family)
VRLAVARLLSLSVYVAVLLATAAMAAAPQTATAPQQRLPYEADMLRLSEIMGALHFLTQLCQGEGTSTWRDQMAALIEAEKPQEARRVRMTDSFNRGYQAYRSVYRSCTPSAAITIDRFRDEGFRIAASIGDRYGRAEGQ